MEVRGTPYIVITIVAFVVLLIIAILWVYVLRAPPSLPPAPEFTQAGFGMRCISAPEAIDSGATPSQFNPQPCGAGLVCIKAQPSDIWGFCRRSVGQQCRTLSECESRAQVCIGVCALSPSGGLNQPCSVTTPCDTKQGLQCSSQGVCKLTGGTPGCLTSNDCLDGACQVIGGIAICTTKQPNGSACSSRLDCKSDFCTDGFCQDPGRNNGVVGAACRYFQQSAPTCQSDLSCFADLSVPDHTFGVCSPTQNFWSGVPCSASAACPLPTACVNGRCTMPTDPNSCAPVVSSGLCSPGYVCTQSVCRPQLGARVPSLPSPGSEERWGLFQWRAESRGGYYQSLISGIPAPQGKNVLSSLMLLERSIHLYRSIDGFWLLPAGRKLVIDGPYNGIQKIGASPGTSIADLQFQVDWIKFTTSGNIAIVYSWIASGVRVSRINVQPLPPSWQTSNPDINLRYYITWTGMSPNSDITPGSSQQTQGNFIQYSPRIQINFTQVDDRLPQVRLLEISTNNQLYTGITTLQDINQGTINLNRTYPGAPALNYAEFYSYSKGTVDIDAFVFLEQYYNRFAIVTPAGQPPVNIQVPAVLTGEITSSSIYSAIGSGIARTAFLYLVQSDDGSPRLHLYNQEDLILPGFFQPNAQVSIANLNQSSDSSVAVPGYFVLTTTS